jgi:hypothetical protein
MQKVWLVLFGDGEALVCDSRSSVEAMLKDRYLGHSDVIGMQANDEGTRLVFLVEGTKELVAAMQKPVVTFAEGGA